MNGPTEKIGFGWFSQSRVNPSGGTLNRTPTVPWSRKLMAPWVGSNMFRQTVATMIWGMTTGRMKIAR